MKFKVVILGAGDHGRVVLDILESEKRDYTVEGFIDIMNNKDLWGTKISGKTVFGGPEKLDELFKGGVRYVAIAKGDNASRRKYFEDVEKRGFTITSVVHPMTAVSKNAYVGKGASISAGAVVSSGARLGRGVIINTGATVDHDCQIDDFVNICPGVHIAGHVTVGENTFIGIGATIAASEGGPLKIGKNAVVAAGAVVLKDVPDGVMVKGNPARKFTPRKRATTKKTTKKTEKKQSE